MHKVPNVLIKDVGAIHSQLTLQPSSSRHVRVWVEIA